MDCPSFAKKSLVYLLGVMTSFVLINSSKQQCLAVMKAWIVQTREFFTVKTELFASGHFLIHVFGKVRSYHDNLSIGIGSYLPVLPSHIQKQSNDN